MEGILPQLLLHAATLALSIIVAVGTTRARSDERVRAIHDRIDGVDTGARARDEAIGKDMQAELDTIHKRINDTRDNYVRRDDFMEALRRIEQGQRDATSEISRLRHAQVNSGTTLAAIAAKLNADDIAQQPQRVPGED